VSDVLVRGTDDPARASGRRRALVVLAVVLALLAAGPTGGRRPGSGTGCWRR
jgi:hypothetical protein